MLKGWKQEISTVIASQNDLCRWRELHAHEHGMVSVHIGQA
jgi:hypothetical protein